MCDFINAHEERIQITSLGEYRVVMKKIMRVIREAHLVERKRRHTSRMKRMDESKTRTQRVTALIAEIRREGMRIDEIEKSMEKILGEGSGREIEKATTEEKIVERNEDMSRRETQFNEKEKMREEAKKRQREDRRLNLFWMRNKCFPAQCG